MFECPCFYFSGTEDLSMQPSNDHLDCSILLKNLQDLKELQLTYASVDYDYYCLFMLRILQTRSCTILQELFKAQNCRKTISRLPFKGHESV